MSDERDIAEILQQLVLVLVPLILSLAVHEFAHAATARLLGDRTAEKQGRFTLNPLSHIDPFGSLIVPGMLVLMGTGVWFGWAKPVPFNPANFTRKIRMKHGILITAAAGPLSNLALATLAALVYHMAGTTNEALLTLITTMVVLNIALFLFNLLPVPPLDGSKVVYGLLPDAAHKYLGVFEKNPWIAPVAFIAVFFMAGRIIGPPLRDLTALMLGL